MGEIRITLVLGSLAGLAVACSSPSPPQVLDSYGGETSSIDHFTFATSTGISQNPAPNVTKTVTGAAAQGIFEATLALAPGPTGAISCPVDWGVTYNMEFYAGTQSVLTVVADPGGCEIFNLSGADGETYVWPIQTPNYWSELAGSLGIDESVIFPYSPPGQP